MQFGGKVPNQVSRVSASSSSAVGISEISMASSSKPIAHCQGLKVCPQYPWLNIEFLHDPKLNQ